MRDLPEALLLAMCAQVTPCGRAPPAMMTYIFGTPACQRWRPSTSVRRLPPQMPPPEKPPEKCCGRRARHSAHPYPRPPAAEMPTCHVGEEKSPESVAGPERCENGLIGQELLATLNHTMHVDCPSEACCPTKHNGCLAEQELGGHQDQGQLAVSTIGLALDSLVERV